MERFGETGEKKGVAGDATPNLDNHQRRMEEY